MKKEIREAAAIVGGLASLVMGVLVMLMPIGYAFGHGSAWWLLAYGAALPMGILNVAVFLKCYDSARG